MMTNDEKIKYNPMEALGKNIAEDWISEVIEYYCKKHGDEGVEQLMEKLDNINSGAVVQYCENHMDLIKRDDIEAEAESMGYTLGEN